MGLEEGWWKLNDNVTDSSGNGNNGSVSGADYTTGKINNAIRFDAAENATCSYTRGTANHAFSLACWIYPTTLDGTYDIFFDGSADYTYRMAVNTNKLTCSFGNGSTNWNTDIVGGTTLSANTWYHVMFIYDGSSNYYIYLNNSSDATPKTKSYNNAAFNGWKLGQYGAGTSNQYAGRVDDLRHFDYALDSTERAFLYNSGNGTEDALTSTTNYTATPAALTLSTTAQGPTIKIYATNIGLSGTLTLQSITLYNSNPVVVDYSHVVVGTGTKGTRFVRTEYPYVEGLTAGTTKLSEDWTLIPEKTIIPRSKRTGI